MDETPDCWTNHQSITQIKNQWYLFYHYNDLSPNFDKARSVRADSLFFNVVNRNEDKAITTDIISTSENFSGKGEASIVNNKDLKTPFSFEKQSQYLPVIKEAKFKGNKLSFTFPPHSFTQIKVGINKK